MGILDNDTVIVDAILTKIGRQKLAQGQPLGITQYAFGDTGVDYTLYNSSHPSGSDSYGSAITSLPMLEAVPDDNVFLRYKLYGQGERNIQKFAYITVENSPITILKNAGETTSVKMTIVPTSHNTDNNTIFNYRILDIRGLFLPNLGGTSGPSNAVSMTNYQGDGWPGTAHPDPVIANILGHQGNLEINAQAAEFSTQKTLGVEVSQEGAASAFVTVIVNANNTTS